MSLGRSVGWCGCRLVRRREPMKEISGRSNVESYSDDVTSTRIPLVNGTEWEKKGYGAGVGELKEEKAKEVGSGRQEDERKR